MYTSVAARGTRSNSPLLAPQVDRKDFFLHNYLTFMMSLATAIGTMKVTIRAERAKHTLVVFGKTGVSAP